jgi:hypothetical protein
MDILEDKKEVFDEGTLSADIAAAFDAAEQADTEPKAEEPEVVEPEKVEESPEEPAAEKDEKPEKAEKPDKVDKPDDDKPPVGLSATAREAWKDTPKPIRDELAKREKDYAKGLQKNAESAKRAEYMDTVLSGHTKYLQSSGQPVGTVLNNLLSVASTLQFAPQEQRAAAIAGLIRDFGVDIETLDNVLVSRPVTQRQEPVQQGLTAEQVMQIMEQRESQSRVTQTLEQFANTHEFYSDVRGDMADLLDLAAKRGQEMTLDEAYKKACAMNDEIVSVTSQRGITPARRAAASSIRGNPGGGSLSAGDGSIKGDIERAIERLSNRM